MSRAFSLAGFEVTLIGRFWVTPEEFWNPARNGQDFGSRYSAERQATAHEWVTLVTKPRAVQKVLFSRIGWMKYYDGPNPKKDDLRPISGGSFNKKNQGTERFNFRKCGRKFYGFVQPQVRSRKLNLERIAPGAPANSNSISGVLLIFVAVSPNIRRQCVVGWYRKATLYRRHQTSHSSRREKLHYSAVTKIGDAVLLPVDMRTRRWEIPARKGGLGRANVFYLYETNGRRKNVRWPSRILKLIASCRFRNKW